VHKYFIHEWERKIYLQPGLFSYFLRFEYVALSNYITYICTADCSRTAKFFSPSRCQTLVSLPNCSRIV